MLTNIPEFQPDSNYNKTETLHASYTPQRPKLNTTRSRGRSITSAPVDVKTPEFDTLNFQNRVQVDNSLRDDLTTRPRANSSSNRYTTTTNGNRSRSASLELSPPLETPVISIKPSKIRPTIAIENIPLSPIPSQASSPISPQLPNPDLIRPEWRNSLPAIIKLGIIFILSSALTFYALFSIKTLHVPTRLTEVRALAFDLRNYMNLSLLNSLHVVSVIGVVYIWKQTWSIPGSAIVNVILGALLPTWLATLYACLLTSVGGFLSSFTALPVAPHIQYHFANAISNLRSINRDSYKLFERLLIARLIPVIPYAVLNLAAGVVGVAYTPFIVSLFLGSIPMNGVACAVGDVLVSLAYIDEGESLSQRMFSYEMITKFTILSLFGLVPVLLKHILAPLTNASTTSTSPLKISMKKQVNRLYNHLVPTSLVDFVLGENGVRGSNNDNCTIS